MQSTHCMTTCLG
ncbi:hypothetical protein E2C01_057047 [Portunus trituberculatus]|uniref:Uncharacterized protein n=1 Tax=Portunus trituberculatus TaxID=210409 RepID=A0A5B7GZB0_PORTR|nr:hypothetical protein [Portunus trituberculatus]